MTCRGCGEVPDADTMTMLVDDTRLCGFCWERTWDELVPLYDGPYAEDVTV